MLAKSVMSAAVLLWAFFLPPVLGRPSTVTCLSPFSLGTRIFFSLSLRTSKYPFVKTFTVSSGETMISKGFLCFQRVRATWVVS